MRLEKPFEELLRIFQNGSAEDLISKSYLIDLKKNKVSGIQIEENRISCTYSPDSKYTYRLMFERTEDGMTEFNVNMPSLYILVLVGGIIGLRFKDDFGLYGIAVGVIAFFGIAKLFKGILQNSIKSRIIARWAEFV